jgi:hypothetical protein
LGLERSDVLLVLGDLAVLHLQVQNLLHSGRLIIELGDAFASGDLVLEAIHLRAQVRHLVR